MTSNVYIYVGSGRTVLLGVVLRHPTHDHLQPFGCIFDA